MSSWADASFAPVLAHINSHPFYREGLDRDFWGAVDGYVFAGCQLAGAAYFLVILLMHRRGSATRSCVLGILAQLLISALLLVAAVFAVLSSVGIPSEVVILPPAAAFTLLARPEYVLPTYLAALGTFALVWGLSRLLLIPAKSVPHKGTASLVHAAVMHPVLFPIGQLVGLMHAIYVARTARRQHGG